MWNQKLSIKVPPVPEASEVRSLWLCKQRLLIRQVVLGMSWHECTPDMRIYFPSYGIYKLIMF